MSNYVYTDSDDSDLSVGRTSQGVVLKSLDRRGSVIVRVPDSDAPTVAAELLKAAGHDVLAQLLADVVEQSKAAIKRAAEKKLQERRDALAVRFGSPHGSYEGMDFSSKLAINYIIQLEDSQP